ncbi:glycosyltransferase family 9 protein [Polycyclovorans algicola]|uniref:glycosyltransferase family 9 protein n=1 Tax=Polycyclovorans algicola TaxID=616992 RepID=UPI0005B91E48|nr:glycosyltransferase family 9 protein [Polycyclovorans algicola]
MASAPLTPPRRILMIRLSALGDLVFATTLLNGLRRQFPKAQIDWLTQTGYAELLGTQTALDQVLDWDRHAWLRSLRQGRWITLWRDMRAFRRVLQARDYDWVIDGQGLFKARLLAWMAGGRWRVGPRSKEPGQWLMHTLLAAPGDNDARIAASHRVGLRELTGTDGEAPRLDRPAGVITPPMAANTLVLAPFTTRPQKHWPEAHWVHLITRLSARGFELMMLGGPADRDAAQRIIGALPASVRLDNRVGDTSLVEATRLIADCRAVIGVDTGLTHMGIAFDRPTVAIFGSTLPYRNGARAPLAVEWLGLDCSPCKRSPTCGGAFTCLQALGPTRIEAALLQILR